MYFPVCPNVYSAVSNVYSVVLHEMIDSIIHLNVHLLLSVRFLKSEVDLDEEIQRIHQIAASPQLISLFIQLNGLNFLIPLLQHANTDLAGEVINVLAEFTSPESILELDDPIKFANIVVSFQFDFNSTLDSILLNTTTY